MTGLKTNNIKEYALSNYKHGGSVGDDSFQSDLNRLYELNDLLDSNYDNNLLIRNTIITAFNQFGIDAGLNLIYQIVDNKHHTKLDVLIKG